MFQSPVKNALFPSTSCMKFKSVGFLHARCLHYQAEEQKAAGILTEPVTATRCWKRPSEMRRVLKTLHLLNRFPGKSLLAPVSSTSAETFSMFSVRSI